MKKIKWGIIGLGKIAHKFAEDLVLLDNAELYAVASRTQEKANEFATKFNAEKAYASYESLVKDNQVDAIYIATPHRFHKENTLLCLEYKKSVLCEKPLAMNLQEVEEMIAAAKKYDVLFMEALWTFFLPHYQHVLDLIKNKSIGEIIELEADFGFKPNLDFNDRLLDKNLGGGSLLDIGIYPIFTALSTLGKPLKIDANAQFFDNGADAECTMVFEYKDAKAKLKSTLLEETKTEAIFTCTNGIIKINTRFHAPSSVTVYQNGEENTITFKTTSNGYLYEIMHFNNLLREGKKESDLMSFNFSKDLINTLDVVRNKIGLEY